MNVKYKVEIVNEPANTTLVEVISHEKTFSKMWKDADIKLKNECRMEAERLYKKWNDNKM